MVCLSTIFELSMDEPGLSDRECFEDKDQTKTLWSCVGSVKVSMV